MNNPDQPNPAAGFSLGGLRADDYDTSLRQPDPTNEVLELPRDAFLALRKSGGLRFTSRTSIVYRDGWVITEHAGEIQRQHLSPHAIARLQHLVLRTGLARWRTSGSQHTPDGYSYEIAARIGRRVRRAEVVDGNIPVPVAAVLRLLRRLR